MKKRGEKSTVKKVLKEKSKKLQKRAERDGGEKTSLFSEEKT